MIGGLAILALLVSVEQGATLEASDGTGASFDLSSDDADFDAQMQNAELGESSGVRSQSRETDATEQTSHIDDEVTALSHEVANLEKDNAHINILDDDSSGKRIGGGDSIDVVKDAPSKVGKLPKKDVSYPDDSTKEESGDANIDDAPPPSNYDESTASSKADTKSVASIPGLSLMAKHPPTDSRQPRLREANYASSASAAQEEAMKLQIQAAEEQKVKAADDKEAAELANTERAAEKKIEQEKGPQAAVLVLDEVPKPLPEAPAPVRPKLSKLFEEARKKPMPPAATVTTLPDGVYAVKSSSFMQHEEKMKLQQQRDIQISKNGGRVPRILPVGSVASQDGSDSSVILTTDGPAESYEPPTPTGGTGYCKSYASKVNGDKPKWTSTFCQPTKGNFRDSMKNIDGVICACGGVKVSIVPPGEAHPGVQDAVVTRGQVAKDRIRSYASRLSSNVDPNSPQPARGLTWEIRLTDEAAAKSEYEVDPQKMQSIFITFNRVFEFIDNMKTGLRSETVKQQDLESGGMWPGIPCSQGKTTNHKDPAANCFLQDFFLDTFSLARMTVNKKQMQFQFESDIQGTAPWCGKHNDKCAVPPSRKPTVTFLVEPEPNSFTESKFTVTIENFPYKKPNSTLALGASIFAETIKSDILVDDKVSTPMPNDVVDCNSDPLPSVCPQVDMDNSALLSWAKFAVDANGKKHKVVSSHPQRYRSGVTSSSGVRLIHKSMYFSFKHGNSKKVTWTPKVSIRPNPLPRQSSAVHTSWAGATMISTITLIAGSLYFQSRHLQ